MTVVRRIGESEVGECDAGVEGDRGGSCCKRAKDTMMPRVLYPIEVSGNYIFPTFSDITNDLSNSSTWYS